MVHHPDVIKKSYIDKYHNKFAKIVMMEALPVFCSFSSYATYPAMYAKAVGSFQAETLA